MNRHGIALCVLVLIWGCSSGGGEAPLAEGALPAVASLLVDSPAMECGETCGLSWALENADTLTDPRLFLTARAPRRNPTALASNPGAVPAVGEVYYLSRNGEWTAEEVCCTSGVLPAHHDLMLPDDTVGEWSFRLYVQDGDELVTGAGASVLVGDEPGLLLRVNRPIANSDDVVTVELLTCAGKSPRDVRITALLETPDGTFLSLPGPGTRLHYAHEGLSRDATQVLFNDLAGKYGLGDYRVRVDLLDADTGRSFRFAEMGFWVSDTDRRVTGMVRDAGGAPLGGGDREFGVVRAFDIDDFGSSQAPIDADGAYALDLEPGRYLFSAAVLDARGLHEARPEHLVVVRDEDLEVDLATRQPLVVQTAARRVARAFAATVCVDLPRPRVWVSKFADNVPDSLAGEASAAYRVFEIELGQRTPEVDFVVDVDLQQYLSWDQSRAALSVVDIDNLPMLGRRMNVEYLLPVTIVGNLRLMDVALIRTEDAAALRKEYITIPEAEHARLGAVRQLAYNVSEWLPGLVGRDPTDPIAPQVEVVLGSDQVHGGEDLPLTTTVQDADCTPAPRQPVEIEHTRPDGSTETISGETDDNGEFEVTLIPQPPPTLQSLAQAGSHGIGTVGATLRARSMTWSAPHRYYRVIADSDLRIVSATGIPVIGPGEEAELCVIVEDDGNPVAGATVDLTSSLGTLSVNRLTTNSEGRACFTITAADVRGLSTVEATYDDGQTVHTASFGTLVGGEVTFNLTANPTRVVHGSVADVTAEVDLGGWSAAGVGVTFTLDGEGEVAPVSGVTDENGRLVVRYYPPDEGAGSVAITGAITIDGVPCERTAEIRYGSLVPGSLTLRARGVEGGWGTLAWLKAWHNGEAGGVENEDPVGGLPVAEWTGFEAGSETTFAADGTYTGADGSWETTLRVSEDGTVARIEITASASTTGGDDFIGQVDAGLSDWHYGAGTPLEIVATADGPEPLRLLCAYEFQTTWSGTLTVDCATQVRTSGFVETVLGTQSLYWQVHQAGDSGNLDVSDAGEVSVPVGTSQWSTRLVPRFLVSSHGPAMSATFTGYVEYRLRP